MTLLQRLTRADGDRQTSLEALGHLMDSQFEVPLLGWRFGLNTLIDLIPGIGDALTSVVAVVIMLAGVQRGVPRGTLVRMAMNIAIYALGGLLPVAGDLFDTWWKPNRRNLDLLARARTDASQAGRSDTAFVWLLVSALMALMTACWAGLGWVLVTVWHGWVAGYH